VDELHNEERSDLYSSPKILRMIKSRRMRWAVYVALWGRAEVFTSFRWGNLRKTHHLEDPGVDERITLRWIFRKWDVGNGLVSIWLRIGTGGGHL
jgi:hypothetical protein